MHKIYLTEPEVSIIKGADVIVKECGGFPSMENGHLCSIKIQKTKDTLARYDVVLLFDIEKWASDSAFYMHVPKIFHKYIEMTFRCVENVYVNNPCMSSTCGEIKFGNLSDRNKMHQDILPGRATIINRPFCVFYIRSGNELVIDFDEEECTISAVFNDSL